MKEEEEGGEENDDSPPTFYMLRQQTRPNKRTNNSKQSHLTGRSSFYHMTKKNTIERPQAQPCAAMRSNHSQESITCLGNTVGQRLPTSNCTNSIKGSTVA